MTLPAFGRGPGLLLACLCVFLSVAAAVRSAVVDGVAAAVMTAGLALCAVAMVVVGWLALRRAEATNVRLRAEVGHLQADRREFAAAQDRFVGNHAHEVKTPLTIVLNQAELLLRCSGDPVAVRGHAKSIVDYVLHTAALSEVFLQLACPLDHADTSHHQPVQLHDLILDVVRRTQAMARGLGVGVVATLPESCLEGDEVEVLGDPVMLEAMVENLVRNAVLGSPRGSQVELQVRDRGESILLEVRDHGAGLAPEHLDSLFDWFCQAPGASPRSSGPCRGLPIARRVVERHRGAIAVRNHPEGGCEVAITLPRWRGQGFSAPDRGIPAVALSVARPA